MITKHHWLANNWKRFGLSVLLVSTALIASMPRAGNSAAATMPQARKNAVVFAVSAEGGDASMDAVVIVDGKVLRAPYNNEQKDNQKNFAEEYFAAGRSYRLIFGGGEAGSVTVKKWSEGCNNIHSEVTPSTSAKLGGRVMALATSSDTLGKRASTRRAPTDAERAEVLTLMKSIYTQHRTPAGLMDSIKVANLTATDLDGDGIGEVFAQQGGFDGYQYLIFKKIAGRWKQVYDMIGDAC